MESICSFLDFASITNLLQTCSSLPKIFPQDSKSWMARLNIQKQMYIKAKLFSNFYYWNRIEITRVELQKTRLLVCSGHFYHNFYSPADFQNNLVPIEFNVYPRWMTETISLTKYSLGYREPYRKEGYCHAIDEFGYWREAKIENDVIQLRIGKIIVSIPLKGNEARVACPSSQNLKNWKNELQINDRLHIVMNEIKYNAKIFDKREDQFILLVDKFGIWEKIIVDKDSPLINPYHIPYPNFKKDHYIFNPRYFVNTSGKKTSTAKEVIVTIDKNSGIHSVEFVD